MTKKEYDALQSYMESNSHVSTAVLGFSEADGKNYLIVFALDEEGVVPAKRKALVLEVPNDV